MLVKSSLADPTRTCSGREAPFVWAADERRYKSVQALAPDAILLDGITA